MIPQRRLTRLYRISWKQQGRLVSGRKFCSIVPKAGHRRLRFSFFADEPNQGSEISDRWSCRHRLL